MRRHRAPLHRRIQRRRLAAAAAALLLAIASRAQALPLSGDTLVMPASLGDKISLFGSRLGQSNMFGFGVESGALSYRSGSKHRWYAGTVADGGASAVMELTSSGRLGIGTTAPEHELVVQGNDPTFQIRDDTTDNSTNAARIELLERSGGNYDGGAFLWWNGASNKLYVGTKTSGTPTNVIVIDRANNNVGIGTSSPAAAYRLAVNGAIRAKEIVVETGWADFVFEDGYALRPLGEVEAHIREHRRLPDLPSAEDVKKNGVSVGEAQTKLLQKVEELTLYLIDLNGRMESLEHENAALRAKLAPAPKS